MELGNHARPGIEIELGVAFNDLAGRISKKTWLYVIPLARYGIQMKALPEFTENLILHSHESGKIKDDGDGPAGNFPPANLNPQTLRQGMLFPCMEEHFILLKFRIFS